MFEHHREPLLASHLFARRLIHYVSVGTMMVTASLAAGIIGYHTLTGFSWLDSLLNASMILSGMGEVSDLHTRAGKIFASFYALFSGVIFISAMAVILA